MIWLFGACWCGIVGLGYLGCSCIGGLVRVVGCFLACLFGDFGFCGWLF